MTIERAKAKHPVTGKQLSLETLAQDVLFDNGKDLQSLYGDIEGDIFSPEVIQTNANSPIGVGDGIDVHNNVQDGAFKSAVLTGLTLNNTVGSTVYSSSFHRYKQIIPLEKTSIYIVKVYNIPSDVKILLTTDDSSGTSKWIIGDYTSNKTFKMTPLQNVNNEIWLHIQGSMTQEEISKIKLLIVPYQDGMENWDIPYFTGMKSVQMPVLTTTGKNLLNIQGKTSEIEYTSQFSDAWYRTIRENTVIIGTTSNGYLSKQNLSNIKITDTSIEFSSRSKGYGIGVKFECIPNESYFLNYTNKSQSGYLSGLLYFTNDYQLIGDTHTYTGAFTTPKDCKYTVVLFKGSVVNEILYFQQPQLEQGTVATPYEPNRTNILSCLEPVELGSVGDVKDTLDCLTGEVVESTKEVLLNNMNLKSKYIETDNIITLHSDNIVDLYAQNVHSLICDTFNVNGDHTSDFVGVSVLDGYIYVRFSKTLFSSVEDIVEWLKINHIKCRYILQQKVVKTVDLSGAPFGFAKGHVQLSNGFEGIMTYNDGFTFPYDVNISKVTTKTGEIIDITGITDNGTSIITTPTCTNAIDYIVTCTPVQSLLPQIKYQVSTSRTGQITQNTNVIMKHDKKIYSLEMMLMSSSVEDAYQRYLLQNDVQIVRTMNISEGNENPLRYHMLSRLIDEGMYDEVDMLAKLDIFMMYGEISMDQYFELTDILLGFTEEFVEEV